jgi:large subunit ribosomal protein L17
MFRNMVTSLFKHERIRTTDVKAKELRRWADSLITLAKRGDVHARRQALTIVREKEVVHKLFAEASERYGSVSGGYTRIVKLGRRPGDAAPISLIELIESEQKKKKKKRKKKTKIALEKKQVVEKKEAEEEKVTASEEKAAEEEKDRSVEETDLIEGKEVEVKTESTDEGSDDKFVEKGKAPVESKETEFREPEAKKAEDDAGDPEVKE